MPTAKAQKKKEMNSTQPQRSTGLRPWKEHSCGVPIRQKARAGTRRERTIGKLAAGTQVFDNACELRGGGESNCDAERQEVAVDVLLRKNGPQNIVADVAASRFAMSRKPLPSAPTVPAIALVGARLKRMPGERAVELLHGLQDLNVMADEGVSIGRHALANLAEGANALLPVALPGRNAALALNKVYQLG